MWMWMWMEVALIPVQVKIPSQRHSGIVPFQVIIVSAHDRNERLTRRRHAIRDCKHAQQLARVHADGMDDGL